MSPHIARELSRRQCDFLLAHIDAPQEIDPTSHGQTRKSLLDHGLLGAYSRPDARSYPIRREHRPLLRFTRLTEHGRATVAQILASYADALVRAGCLDPMALPITPIRGRTAHIEDSARRQPALTNE